jgi:hypothetical protein
MSAFGFGYAQQATPVVAVKWYRDMCRSRVTSWLQLCVLLVFGMAGALIEGNRTVCHYMVSSCIHTHLLENSSIQSVPGGKVNILWGHSIGHSKQKSVYVHVSYSEQFPKVYMYIFPIPNGFRKCICTCVLFRTVFGSIYVYVSYSERFPKMYMHMCPIPNGFRHRAI